MPNARLRLVRDQSERRDDDTAWATLEALGDRIEAGGRSGPDPARAIFGLLGDRWSMLILLTLSTGEWRHATLKRIVSKLSVEGAISQRVLTLKLRTMERDGLVRRTVSDDVPPRVAYRLTAIGADLLDRAAWILRWANDHRTFIIESRRRFDARLDD